MYQTSLTKGQELTAQRMVREFRAQGYDAYLITSIYSDWEPVVDQERVIKAGGYVHLFDESLGIPVVRVKSSMATWPPRRVSFSDFVATLTSIVDDLKLNVLITHSTLWDGPEQVLKFVEWRRRMWAEGAPGGEVVFCHMSHFQEPSDERYAVEERSYRKAWNEVSLSKIVSEADFVLVTTPIEMEQMVKLGADRSRCVLFPGGIEDIRELPESAVSQRLVAIPEGARLVTVLGTVEERKNTLAVLSVAERMSAVRGLHFVIAGRLEGEYGRAVSERAKKLSNVSVIGEVDESEKVALIRRSYINLTMSRAEALGLSQLEFMLCGVPVVSSGAGGQSWLVSDGRNGLLLKGPDDVDGACASISELLRNRAKRDRIAREAARFASSFLMTRLIRTLSKHLERRVAELADKRRRERGLALEERTIDAWASPTRRVAATNRSLLIDDMRKGGDSVRIPYDELMMVTPHVKYSRSALLLGASATVFLLLERALKLNIEIPIAGRLASLIPLPLPSALSFILWFAGPFVPLAVGGLFTVLTAKQGYLVHRREKEPVFLPREFEKALRLADKLTPHDLFVREPTSG
jgi:D-inositol-3-phosphate glycosyltransferase